MSEYVRYGGVFSEVLKLDSTPIEASRYNKYCDYNSHYGCKMDKAHITMIRTCPVFMSYTEGNEGDSPQLPYHINALLVMNANINKYYLDAVMIHFKTMQTYGTNSVQSL